MVVHIPEEHEKTKVALANFCLRDNGGRRSDIDRRQFSYAGHVPERREGEERRTGLDRRRNKEGRVPDRRRSVDRKDFVIA